MLSLLCTRAARAQTDPAQTDAAGVTCGDYEPSSEDLRLERLAIRSIALGQAGAALLQLPTENPTHTDSSAALATARATLLYAQRQYEPALQALGTALRLQPCYPPALYLAWRLDALAGRRAAAGSELHLAHHLAPTNAYIAATWSAVQHAAELASRPGAPAVTVDPQRGFYAKSLDCSGIAVRASAEVDDSALILGCADVDRMLLHRPDVRQTLHRRGGELHIIGDRQQTSDLPENHAQRGVLNYAGSDGQDQDIDQRTRGVGTLTASCGEENLLRLPYDRYREGEDICVHEFAHEIMNFGLSGGERREIQRVYKASMGQKLWAGAYSATNPQEFWATLSMWYFGTHGQFLPSMRPDQVPRPGPAGLKAYDTNAFNLLDRLYRPPSR